MSTSRASQTHVSRNRSHDLCTRFEWDVTTFSARCLSCYTLDSWEFEVKNLSARQGISFRQFCFFPPIVIRMKIKMVSILRTRRRFFLSVNHDYSFVKTESVVREELKNWTRANNLSPVGRIRVRRHDGIHGTEIPQQGMGSLLYVLVQLNQITNLSLPHNFWVFLVYEPFSIWQHNLIR